MENDRLIALEALLAVARDERPCHIVLKQTLAGHPALSKQELSFITRLVNGTIERRLTLDHLIGCFSKTPVQKLKPVILEILRLSVYQLKYMDSVPDSAVCNEAVKLCAKKGFHGLKGYVNGVLRHMARDLDQVTFPDRKADPLSYLSLTYSMPALIVKKLTAAYGEETTERILASSLENRPLFIRTNISRVSPKELEKRLAGEGLSVTGAPYLPYAFSFSQTDYIADNRAFSEGLYGISDIGAMLAVALSGVSKGFSVLDVCAAPGGKTCHLADLLHGTGEVLARDISEEKTALIKDNLRRQGFPLKPAGNCTVEVHDARVFSEELSERFDLVLADLPCSGLGVMGRKPDLKYRLTEEDLEALPKLQREILRTVSRYVKPGGLLLYCTCTLNPDENREIADWFLSEFPFKASPLTDELPKELSGAVDAQGFLQLIPGVHASDGFFIARFRK
ncbi:MAG: 16S rRNA (cytosine(967)-C(5))-methyltransferase RsmB [Lachnospiraceae bacterium]|nr:16S rRNA (cytosine(967)-C(5))-methyltransferase RsmB [Lachnospiraceae bacterium]